MPRGEHSPSTTPPTPNTPTVSDGLRNFGHTFLGDSLTAASDFLWIFVHALITCNNFHIGNDVIISHDRGSPNKR